MRRSARKSVFAVAVAAGALLVVAGPAGAALASTGTATLGAGTLSMSAPSTLAFSATLTGAAQAVTAPQAFDVVDSTGSGSGWNITVTSTTWTSGSNTLATSSTTDTAASGACDATITCTLGDNSATSYPVTVPAAATAPSAIEIQTAAANSGLAGQTWTHTMSLAVPAVARAGTYSSTWTYSLVSGP
jgi:hypothetical protein